MTADLVQLLDVHSPQRQQGTRTPLTAGETVLGRFFFVQRTEAVREDRTTLRTYEFLHATFGEYLVARLVWNRLVELRREDEARSRRKAVVDDTDLYAVLSFAALTSSKPVLDFLRGFAEGADRDGLCDLVTRLFFWRDESRASRGAYTPVRLTDSVRDAKYSLNLVVLALVLRGRCYSDQLGLGVDGWRRLTLFWKSRLPSSEWAGVVLWLWVERDAARHFSVCLNSRERETGPEWLLMAEPYVTLDEVAMTLRDAVTPLVSQHGIEVTAALVGLMATPVGRCVPALRRLREADSGQVVFRRELFARLGTGGDDASLLELYPVTGRSEDAAQELEALLRLRDLGVDQGLLAAFLAHRDLRGLRPDLLTRARRAAEELGLESSW
ncbi:hypothetical protein [Lentzea sp. HUAS12]|uniref:hypothetical protein n=1 Tax=Lentzea sp. HUAS12 TaxID=2951806 RepID=UPI00209F9721|nr:hypothetical protein [Lentzea sp. HUAS12]USX54279.1 hypothetical protein ND450_09310 [Lentzea sp. HUAS12]